MLEFKNKLTEGLATLECPQNRSKYLLESNGITFDDSKIDLQFKASMHSLITDLEDSQYTQKELPDLLNDLIKILGDIRETLMITHETEPVDTEKAMEYTNRFNLVSDVVDKIVEQMHK